MVVIGHCPTESGTAFRMNSANRSRFIRHQGSGIWTTSILCIFPYSWRNVRIEIWRTTFLHGYREDPGGAINNHDLPAVQESYQNYMYQHFVLYISINAPINAHNVPSDMTPGHLVGFQRDGANGSNPSLSSKLRACRCLFCSGRSMSVVKTHVGSL